MLFVVPRVLPLSLLAAIVLVGCVEKGAVPLKQGKTAGCGECRTAKMPASVKERNAWADALAKTFESQKIAPPRRISARCWPSRNRSLCTVPIRSFPD